MEIELTQGKCAIIDNADARLAKHKWQYNDTKGDGNGYAVRNITRKGITKRLYMHRVIAKASPGELVKHKNDKHLDNRRDNLIKVSHSQRASYTKGASSATGYRGVYEQDSGKFKALITINGNTKQLGTFVEPEEAARMYDVAAYEYHGDMAALNFPDSVPTISLRDAMHAHQRARLRMEYEQGERSSPYMGVTSYTDERWRATIQIRGEQKFIGAFDEMEEAAHAYDNAARLHYGPNVFVNFPNGND